MKVLIDCLWWVSGPPSGRNIVRDLVHSWREAFPGDDLGLYVLRADAPQVAVDVPGAQIVLASALPGPHALRARGMRRHAAQFDVVVTQNFGLGKVGSTSIVILYDTIFVRHPEWFARRERLYLSLVRPSLRHTDAVVTAASSERDEILRVWPEVADKTYAIGFGVPRELLDAEASPVHGVVPPFVLSVGRFNIRKNLGRLSRAFLRSSISDSHSLVIVGPKDGLAESLGAAAGPATNIAMLGPVPLRQLRWLYENASALAFPSLDEGYGLPAVEAQALGLPVIGSDIAPFRELDSVDVYFDPLNEADIAAALERVPTLSRKEPLPAGGHGWGVVVARLRETAREASLEARWGS